VWLALFRDTNGVASAASVEATASTALAEVAA
jgi:hypothetical protein